MRSQRNTANGNSAAARSYGVGRINYSMKDSRITDSLAGLEYDAGCWIGRVVAERAVHRPHRSHDAPAAATRAGGLVTLGSNPLAVLKDNIPGYTLLRDERVDPPVRNYVDEGASAPPAPMNHAPRLLAATGLLSPPPWPRRCAAQAPQRTTPAAASQRCAPATTSLR